MRTASVVIVDELRLFHQDLLGDLVDRMAAYGGEGRLITASSAGFEHECKTTVELEKIGLPALVSPLSRRATARMSRTGATCIFKGRRYPIYVMPCCGAALEGIPFRHARWRRAGGSRRKR